MIDYDAIPKRSLAAPPPGRVQWRAKMLEQNGSGLWVTSVRGEKVFAQTWYVARLQWSRLLDREPGELDVQPVQ